MSVTKKIAKLESRKLEIEQELFLLKQQNVQKLSAALTYMEDLNLIDMYTLIGGLLKVLEGKHTDKETLHAAGKSFCRKFKTQMDSLLPPVSKDSLAHRKAMPSE